MMKIKIASILVNNQEQALQFYSGVLGFEKKDDIPLGEHRWLSVVSPGEPQGTELLLESNAHEAARVFQAAMFADGIPATLFFVDDIQAEYERLKDLDVTFTMEPTTAGEITLAMFDDSCGNLIQLVQQ